MRRQRAPRESQKLALFTFLDVLICTMGLLILLLVAIANQAWTRASDETQLVRDKAEEDRQKLASLEEHVKMLRMIKQEGEQELLRRRAALQDIESRARKMVDELAELEAAQALLANSPATELSAQRQAELARLKSRIATLQKQLAETRQQAAAESGSFAIIPYRGPNQTKRRPIYIECRQDAIVLQPEGIVLTAADFEGPLGPGNPLAAGVRAAEQYLGRNIPLKEQEQEQPYPLLLVRPDGINSYYVARAALKSWGSDFGYELVEQDWKLKYQADDRALAAVEQRAVEEGRQRQRELAMSVAMGGRGGGSVRGGYGGGGSGRSGAPTFEDRVENPESHSRATYRVAADGRIVRDRRASQQPVSRHGSSLSRYSDIVGDSNDKGDPLSRFEKQVKQGAGSSGVSAAPSASQTASGMAAEELPAPGGSQPNTAAATRSTDVVAGATGTGSGGTLTPGRARNAAGMPGQPSVVAQPSETAVATDQQGPRILPQQMFGQHESRDLQSLAATHGKNWALPDASRGSLPVTRPIRVECRADGVTLLSEYRGGPAAKTIPFGSTTANSVDALVTAIWERMDTWGIAGKGLYWRPELHIVTAPGGEARLGDLRALLADSGLEIHEPSQAAAAAGMTR
jgi:hypothetical protein